MATESSKSEFVRIEPVVIGDDSSRLSRAVFVLLLAIPVLSTVLFGAVDSGTWILISVLMTVIFVLWLGEEWNTGGFFLTTNPLQLPLVGLIVIGIIQLLPIGSDISGGLLKFPASNALSLDPYSTRFFVARLVIYLVFFAGCLIFINTERRILKTSLLIVIFGSLMAFFGILQRLAHPE